MRNIWVIARREYKLYFNSPIFYAVGFLIFLILGIIFYSNIGSAVYNQYAPGIQIVVGPMVTLFLFTTPAITMRTISEEVRTGTLELMLTAPVRDGELIVGKWLGAFLFMLTIIAVTWVYPLMLNQLVKPGIDQGLMVSAYLGVILMAAAFTAVGIATSTFFGNQIAAFFTALGILLVMWMVSYPAQAMGASTSAEVLRYLDMSEHFYNTFFQGVIELKDIIYYISLTTLALVVGTVSIETRRWR